MKRLGELPVELIDLQGTWHREGRSISDGAVAEVADVLWLQAGRHFCDLRTPHPGTDATSILDMPQAFSGTVQVRGGAISFHHDLDSLRRDPAHPDAGSVHRKDDVMFERGPDFEERWVLVARPGTPIGCAELRRDGSTPTARLVRVGPVALAVWGGASPGGAHYAQERQWGTARSLGESDTTMEVDRAARSMGEGTPLPEGWIVVDREVV